ncbi:MAG: hypothetical protein K2X77_17420 [Candidatus Obscuribacterales bacterium]|nr:hypothetical protein [Candidatus Obscuribacterales bacterium]
MPKITRTPQIQTRLTKGDNSRLNDYCKAHKLTKTEVTREAIRCYLDSQENRANEKRDDLYAQAIKKMADRIVAFLVPIRRDISSLIILSSYNIEDKRQLQAALKFGFDRMRKQLPADEKALADFVAARLAEIAKEVEQEKDTGKAKS